jgi:hypothetical protein
MFTRVDARGSNGISIFSLTMPWQRLFASVSKKASNTMLVAGHLLNDLCAWVALKALLKYSPTETPKTQER